MDTARIFASGYSNGGQFAFALGAQLSDRIAAIAPCAGTPHPGFGAAPSFSEPSSGSLSMLVIHGVDDDVCPANSTEPSVDGWFYETVGVMTSLWAAGHSGCGGQIAEHFPTGMDGVNGLYCVRTAECSPPVDIVRCAWCAKTTMNFAPFS